MTNPFAVSDVSRSSLGTSTRAALGVGAIDPPAKSVVLTSGGNITVKTLNGGVSIPFVGLPAGYVIPYIVSEIVAIGGGAVAYTIDG